MMKKISIILLCLFFSCNSKKKQEDNTKMILGKWALTTNKMHILEIGTDSIYYSARKDYKDQQLTYCTYQLFGDRIKMKFSKLDTDLFALSFKGNDTLILNGIDGEHIYSRIK